MVLKITDILLMLVIKFVNNINILHYKMETDKLVGVVVKMIYLVLQCTDQHHVDKPEVHGVIMFGKITNTPLHYHLHQLLIFLDILTH